jgi:hypothetical protein
MLFRIITRAFSAKAYFNHYFMLLTAKIEHFENDYRKDLKVIFYLLVFKPIKAIVEFILFCLNAILFIINILLTANNIVLRFLFIKIPVNVFEFFLVCFTHRIQCLVMEFIFMFVDTYVFYFINKKREFIIECKDLSADFFGYPKGYGSFAMEIYPDEYQDYLDSFDKNPGPNLNVYYPMRFALSSVMIRLTGVILALSFFLFLFFYFTNLFIIVNANPSVLRRSVDYKLIETFFNYSKQYQKYTLNPEKYNNKTFYSTFKCIMILIYTYIKICLKYLFFDAYIRFSLVELFKIKYLTLSFFYNFFIYIFIYVLPIHFYYVVYHSYKIIYISTYVGYLYDFLKKILTFFFKILFIVLKKVWLLAYEIATVEEPDVHAPKNKKKENQNTNTNNQINN